MTNPKISAAEWEVMRVLWRSEDALSANDVIALLSESTDWQPKTIRTLINRLTDKGILQRQKREKVFLFAPAVAEQECIREEGQTFLDRYFGGGLQPMLAHFLEEKEVSDEEIDALRKLLDEKRKER